jgi:diguanylate cyclase (GGDEF)-like protein/PAS domain S-box-containing protein
VAAPITSRDHDGWSRADQAAPNQLEEALRSQPRAARLFVACIIAAGASVLVFWGPRQVPSPALFAALLAASALASSLRLRVPLGVSSSNLSVSYSVDFAALLLIGTELTMLVAGISAWLQSAFGHDHRRNPAYRTIFNASALVLTVRAAGLTFEYMGGQPGVLDLSLRGIAKPVVASALVYYLVNTSIVATAVALANRKPVWSIWHSNFLWTAPSYYVGAGAAVAAAILWKTQQWWLLPFAIAPVYLTFRSYRMYVDRLRSEERHKEEMSAALENARRSEERFRLAVDGSNDGIWDWDVTADALYCSPRWKLMIGLSPDDRVSTLEEWLDLADEEDRPALQQAIHAHLTSERSHFEIEYRMRHVDGSFRWVHCRGIAERENGAAVRLAGSQTDITEQRRIRDSLAQAAQHDALTDLPNRTLFRELVQRAIAQTSRTPSAGYGVLFIDLDGFKAINDTHGHVAGDRFLKSISRRLHAQLRPGDVLARLGGDEFGVLAHDITSTDDLCMIAQRLQQALAEPFQINKQKVRGAASIGIVVGTPESKSVDALLRDADIAMYRAKAAGRGGYELFDAAMHSAALKRLTFETELRRAIERNHLTVFYQPIVQLPSSRISGVEALVRWERADGRMLSPSDFIAVAEETGLIVPLTYQVLGQACHQVAAWQQMFGRPLELSVNISPKLFSRPEFIDKVDEALRESSILPGTLRLEIPESVLIDHSDVVGHHFDRLRALQVALHLDNFGTGYASLSYLQRYPVDALKLDKSFVARMGTPGNDGVGGAIVKLARELGMGLIAEGVETVTHVEQLRALDCPHAQGYLFSRPLTASEMAPLLASESTAVELPAAS